MRVRRQNPTGQNPTEQNATEQNELGLGLLIVLAMWHFVLWNFVVWYFVVVAFCETPHIYRQVERFFSCSTFSVCRRLVLGATPFPWQRLLQLVEARVHCCRLL